ncbi:MAG TPA: AtpZ/AtpI family protein [Thermoanaerobaculia bacterium]|nr:AtpZ/AtpI family protein [Thermoanaerobaculia bacterium]
MDDKKRRDMRQMLEASSIGWMFPIAIGLGFGWGWWMDKLFGTKPWLTVVFTVFGIIAAFVNLFRFATKNGP